MEKKIVCNSCYESGCANVFTNDWLNVISGILKKQVNCSECNVEILRDNNAICLTYGSKVDEYHVWEYEVLCEPSMEVIYSHDASLYSEIDEYEDEYENYYLQMEVLKSKKKRSKYGEYDEDY